MRLRRTLFLLVLAASAVVTPLGLAAVLFWASLRAIDRAARQLGAESYINKRAEELNGGTREWRDPRAAERPVPVFSAEDDLEFTIEALERVGELVDAGQPREALDEIERTFEALVVSSDRRALA